MAAKHAASREGGGKKKSAHDKNMRQHFRNVLQNFLFRPRCFKNHRKRGVFFASEVFRGVRTDGSVVGTRVSAHRNNVQPGVHFVTNRSHWWPQMSCRGFRSVQVPTVGNPVERFGSFHTISCPRRCRAFLNYGM